MATKCAQCGYCCTRIVTKIRTKDAWLLEYYRARGMDIIDQEGREEKLVFIVGDNRCPHLTEDNKCGIQGKKPTICKIYPMGIRKEEINDKCVFKEK